MDALVQYRRSPFEKWARRYGILLVSYYLFGCAAYSYLEGWTYVEVAYYLTTTATTIGYGDFCPTTEAGRALTTVYAPIGVVAVIGAIVEQVDVVLQAANTSITLTFLEFGRSLEKLGNRNRRRWILARKFVADSMRGAANQLWKYELSSLKRPLTDLAELVHKPEKKTAGWKKVRWMWRFVRIGSDPAAADTWPKLPASTISLTLADGSIVNLSKGWQYVQALAGLLVLYVFGTFLCVFTSGFTCSHRGSSNLQRVGSCLSVDRELPAQARRR